MVYFMSIDDVKFRKPVFPGDLLHFEVHMVTQRRRMCKMSGKAYVHGEVVAEALLTAAIVDRDNMEKK